MKVVLVAVVEVAVTAVAVAVVVGGVVVVLVPEMVAVVVGLDPSTSQA